MQMWGTDQVAAAVVQAGALLQVPVVVFPSAHRDQWGTDPVSGATYRRATRILAQLEADADVYRDLGVPEERIVICGACSPALAAGGGRDIRSRFSIKGPLVLFLGARRYYKGFDLLLRAAPLVAAARPDVTFAFVGPGEPLLINHHRARVLDIGEVDDAERTAWLDAADLLCLPSEAESFGLVVIEAWSLRTPVIVSDIPTLSELVSKGEGGVSVPRDVHSLARAILNLVEDPKCLTRLGASGYAYWAAHYTVAHVAACHERVYVTIAQARSRRNTDSTALPNNVPTGTQGS